MVREARGRERNFRTEAVRGINNEMNDTRKDL